MVLRSLALALLLLCCGAAMSPATATTAEPAAEVAVAAQSNPTSAELLARIWNSTLEGLRTIPLLREAPAYLIAAIGDPDHGAAVSQRFWLIVLAGLLAAPLVGSVTRRLFDRAVMTASWRAVSRLRIALLRLMIGLISLLAVAALLWIALVSVSGGNRLLEETADRIVRAIIEWRLAIIALTAVFSPRVGELRLLRIDDADAVRCMRWLRIYAAIAPLDYCLIWLIERLGFAPQVVFGTAMALGTATTIYKIAMIWVIRRPIARAILAATQEEAPPFRRAVAASWHWLFILLALAIWVASAVAFSLGKGASVYGSATITQVIAVVLAVGWQAVHKLIQHFYADASADVAAGLRRQRFADAMRRLCDLLFVVIGLAWLAEVWGLDLIAPAPGSVEQLALRPILLTLVTLIAAWIIWLLLSGIIDEKMPRLAGPGDEDEDIAEHASRLGTLLPLLRNLMMVLIGIVAVAVALSTLGLDLAPILAGLGVIGIALGFGAQHLVRDIISGIFFLMEDAFRVGDYIDTGRLRGTVEGMSLRSVRLRHQNGPVHTIPFGQVLAVTNFSRDWSVVKFNLHLDPTVEIELVRKTVKRVGQELLEDPEIGGEFIQPLKMQGVIDVLQSALVVRCKFTALPGRPTYLQRQALRRLIEAFGNAEIPFAAPNVMVQLSSASGW